MPYRRKKGADSRPGLYTSVTLPRFGKLRKWTGVTDMRTARAMEAWLLEVAITRPKVVETLVAGDVDLPQLWIAKAESTPDRDRIEELLEEKNNPLLSVAAETYRLKATDARVKDGLKRLSPLADEVERRRAEAAKRNPPKEGMLRLSWLLIADNVSDLYDLAQETQSAGGVRRSIHRAVSELLDDNFGKVKVHNLMLDVRKPEVSDERTVRVSPEELQTVLRFAGEMEPLFRDFVALAILLAVDRTPLTRIRPRFFDSEAGMLEVFDTKTGHRHRTLELSYPAYAILKRLCAGRKPDDVIFPWSEGAIRHRWEQVRDRAAGNPTRNSRNKEKKETDLPEGIVTLGTLRFKDLRHLLPTAWSALKLPQRELQEVMGHAPGSKMTDRYITPVGAREHMDKVAEWLGIQMDSVAA